MKRVIASYRVKPEQVERNEELVRAVYEELHASQPDGMRYATFKLDDGVSFVHIHSSENESGGRALPELPTFKKFQEGINERCDKPPVVTEMYEIGLFRLFE